MVQLSHLFMTTVKTIALIIWMIVSKVISMLFYRLSRFFIAFLPRNKLGCMLQSAMILEPRKENLSQLPLFHLLLAMK